MKRESKHVKINKPMPEWIKKAIQDKRDRIKKYQEDIEHLENYNSIKKK
mgnify:CR=1 FL=1